ncbi:MAG: LysM peptidoglycan-binding domain-containing protein [Anaerolineaceae bacterium]
MPVILFADIPIVQAQTASCSQVIQAVNQLRSAYGLAAYETSSKWTSVAQTQSEYQASVGELTHLRADGTGPGDQSISSENIGGGTSISAEGLLYQWADYWHAFTMVGFSNGLVGCGVAQGQNGYYYYTLVVKNTGTLTGLPPAGSSLDLSGPADSSTGGTAGDASGIPVVTALPNQGSSAGSTRLPNVTATPQADGSVSHTISSGETVWSISELYDIPVNELIALNYLDAESPIIFPGQTLKIKAGYTPTATSTITQTPLPPTRTLRPSRTPQPSRTLQAAQPTGTVTGVPLVPQGVINRSSVNTLGVVTLVLACLGGAALGFGRLWNKRKR